jgi:hypothetical protein
MENENAKVRAVIYWMSKNPGTPPEASLFAKCAPVINVRKIKE